MEKQIEEQKKQIKAQNELLTKWTDRLKKLMSNMDTAALSSHNLTESEFNILMIKHKAVHNAIISIFGDK